MFDPERPKTASLPDTNGASAPNAKLVAKHITKRPAALVANLFAPAGQEFFFGKAAQFNHFFFS